MSYKTSFSQNIKLNQGLMVFNVPLVSSIKYQDQLDKKLPSEEQNKFLKQSNGITV